jgi:hypothetical protein
MWCRLNSSSSLSFRPLRRVSWHLRTAAGKCSVRGVKRHVILIFQFQAA